MDLNLKEDEKLLYSLRALYRQYGYRSFRMSKFEKYELYARNKDFLVSDRVITFTDTNGDLLALKPDVTLSIVRNASFRPGWKQKLYYHENVYRPSGSDNRFREIMQCGLECIGDLDSYDVCEVLDLAEQSLRLISDNCILSVSHLGILRSLLNALGAEEEQRRELLRLVAARNEHELAALFESRGWDRKLLADLRALLGLSCSLEELPGKLRALEPQWLDQAVWKELEELSLLSRGRQSLARFDLSVINDIHYYNGIVFQGFIQSVAEKVLSGGRYDSLLERMNRRGRAIGFAIYVGLLEQVLRRAEEFDADVLVLYDRSVPVTEVQDAVKRLRESGRSVSAQRCTEGRYREICDLRGGEKHA
ncbi:MAG: ATP phosphoribosyltransferase regulatory subunit [Oscillospiraceae bacterium]|nr:ATP phosphoribosyltransferase regulatory subunit [Oscillospiraceae bacterium]